MSPKRPQHHGFTFSAFISIVHVSWTFNLLRSSSNSSNSRRSADLSYSTESWCNGEREILSLPCHHIHYSSISGKPNISKSYNLAQTRLNRSSCCLDRHSRARLCLTQQERWCVYSQHPPQVDVSNRNRTSPYPDTFVAPGASTRGGQCTPKLVTSERPS
ncbi:hypothetical protein BJ322DRAFT_1081109 [Thelephora terrestris]|uniref:Uncharacterized protein n=1 Tax=Thelephora terrestris TaxID=56493 RepID=A0A9P6L440_9AGAM|nr:hypothetical protein BJ322DRAFT_1096127 [Thelephora terrestris]KAF9781421.1 hypothetical protein BJ322DRAFT_1081109 [Thelephora terrestris]